MNWMILIGLFALGSMFGIARYGAAVICLLLFRIVYQLGLLQISNGVTYVLIDVKLKCG